jgi:hypothetical protein
MPLTPRDRTQSYLGKANTNNGRINEISFPRRHH